VEPSGRAGHQGGGVFGGCLTAHDSGCPTPSSFSTDGCERDRARHWRSCFRYPSADASRDGRGDEGHALLPADILASTVQLGAPCDVSRHRVECLGTSLPVSSDRTAGNHGLDRARAPGSAHVFGGSDGDVCHLRESVSGVPNLWTKAVFPPLSEPDRPGGQWVRGRRVGRGIEPPAAWPGRWRWCPFPSRGAAWYSAYSATCRSSRSTDPSPWSVCFRSRSWGPSSPPAAPATRSAGSSAPSPWTSPFNILQHPGPVRREVRAPGEPGLEPGSRHRVMVRPVVLDPRGHPAPDLLLAPLPGRAISRLLAGGRWREQEHWRSRSASCRSPSRGGRSGAPGCSTRTSRRPPCPTRSERQSRSRRWSSS
jgi:hypothetical protein